ncbi:hypothetical protein QA644_08240 [Rhizobium sp. CC1099]|uniref:hypothetical protein n=1 Tax=Rhizobium sp. CC1099 TaxID=3039160 RepID=UPI0024B0BB38|nr:hypothetical protein [Rhizobium sp. CC1099]WFU89018.1 hypothetical protein QA644_08240 [Rhizobium sp. CC1099]
MAKLPPIDVHAYWVRNLLHRGKRPEALARLNAAIDSGKAGPETIALADYLANAKRGRQPFGATYLWYEIGIDNDEMRAAGIAYDERMDRLGGRYMLAKTQIETAVAKFEASMDAVRNEERDGES